MTVEQTVRNHLLLHPACASNRWEALYLLFFEDREFVWMNGELTDGADEEASVEEAVIKHFESRFNSQELLDTPLRHLISDCLEDVLATVRIDKRAEDMTPRRDGEDIYLRRHANILHIPEDVEDDWLAAAKEIYQSVMAFNLPQNKRDLYSNARFPR